MLDTPVAAWLDSYRRGFKDSLAAAAADGFRGVFANAMRADFNPDEFGDSARRHLKKHLADLGARMVGVAVEFPGAGLADAEHADRRIAQVRKTLELAADLGLPVAATRLGGLVDPRVSAVATQAIQAAADAAERFGVTLAVHADGTDVAALCEQVRRLDCRHLRLGLDSATLDLAGGVAGGATPLAADIWLRDVRRRGGELEETDFGRGDVDFSSLLASLEAGEFRGVITVRRDAASAGVDALRQGREYIAALLARGR